MRQCRLGALLPSPRWQSRRGKLGTRLRNASIPALMHSSLSSSDALAVSAMMRSRDSGAVRPTEASHSRMRRVASTPPHSGICLCRWGAARLQATLTTLPGRAAQWLVQMTNAHVHQAHVELYGLRRVNPLQAVVRHDRGRLEVPLEDAEHDLQQSRSPSSQPQLQRESNKSSSRRPRLHQWRGTHLLVHEIVFDEEDRRLGDVNVIRRGSRGRRHGHRQLRDCRRCGLRREFRWRWMPPRVAAGGGGGGGGD